MRTVNKLALNSLALYVNMGFTMLATLLGTRYVLEALGKEEFGLYALIGSIVAMLSFLNVAMAAATQRFLSYAIGAKNEGQVREIFFTSVVIHLAIAAVLSVFLLAGGEFMIYNVLDIAPQYFHLAEYVLWCMIAGVLFTINAVPYEATMNAHEDISQIAVINILEAALKLGAAVVVLFLSSDKLLLYALLVLFSQIFAFACKWGFSKFHYEEATFHFHRLKDRGMVQKMLGYAGWNLIGAGCSIARYQGAAILLNAFFGLAINAAYGVAQQINGFILFFANSIVRPMRPLIVKSEGACEHERMHELSYTTCRITFLMMSFAIIPLYQNMPYVLSIWLDQIPQGTLQFCRAFLLIALVNQLSVGVVIAIESVGNIKRLQLVVGTMHLAALPLGYAAFVMGYSAYSIMACILIEEIVATVFRLWVAKKDAGLPWRPYVSHTLTPCVLSFVLCFALTSVSVMWIDNALYRFVFSTLSSTIILALLGYFVCLTHYEKEMLHTVLSSVLRRGRKEM